MWNLRKPLALFAPVALEHNFQARPLAGNGSGDFLVWPKVMDFANFQQMRVSIEREGRFPFTPGSGCAERFPGQTHSQVALVFVRCVQLSLCLLYAPKPQVLAHQIVNEQRRNLEHLSLPSGFGCG